MIATKDLKVALIQTDLAWENPAENRKRFQEKIENISEPIDLIILPEMFTSGFTMNASSVAEPMDGDTVLWMQSMAKEKQTAITGSLVISERNNFYNRLVFVHPSGEIEIYDKRHTFTLAGEDKIYSAGNKKLIVDYKGWKICPLICYDLRFPVLARNVEHYDILFYVASWPSPRITAWDTLLKARAIENMSYVIGVNRVGKDVNKHLYPGHSSVFDGLGNELCKNEGDEAVLILTLEKGSQHKIRDKFGFLEDKDNFTLH